MLTGSHDRTTRFWNATSGEPAGEPHDHAAEVWAVAFHPTKAVIAVAGADRAIRFWTYPGWTAAFRDWGKIFDADNTLATAMIDRLMHHGEAILMEGDRSFRDPENNPE